jgi:hypothetical protein
MANCVEGRGKVYVSSVDIAVGTLGVVVGCHELLYLALSASLGSETFLAVVKEVVFFSES